MVCLGGIAVEVKVGCLRVIMNAFEETRGGRLLVTLVKVLKVVFDDRGGEITKLIPTAVNLIQSKLNNNISEDLLSALCGLVDHIMTSHFKR
tara:strand:+ start:115 stop:390 length:276 start_codon:yes stop_codon:yes gene_type:complete